MISFHFPALSFQLPKGFYLQIQNVGGFFFQCVQTVLLLNISKTYSDYRQTSECHLSKETKTMHIIQMVQEQHAIYFGYDFLGVLGKF